MKIALYKAYGNETATIYESTDWREESEAYIRMSEIIEVELLPLPAEATIPKELAVLASTERKLTNNYMEAKAHIEVRRANLLSLTHQVQA